MEIEPIGKLQLTKLNSSLVVAVRAGGGPATVLELQVAAVVLVELERGRGGEGQLVRVMSRGRRGAPLRLLDLVAVSCRWKSRLQGIGQVRGTLLLLRGLESSVVFDLS